MQTPINLPTDVDAERFVLGSLMLTDALFDEAQGMIEAGDFSLQKHRTIFTRMVDVRSRGETVDRVTVSAELEKHREREACDGFAYLMELDAGLPQLASIASYIRIVKEKAVLRRLISLFQHLMNQAIIGEDNRLIGNLKREDLELLLS